MADVLVIAGTADARQMVERLVKLNIKVGATVTTRYGNELLSRNKDVEVYEGKLDAPGMAELIKNMNVKALIDASHPFAREASVNAIEACKQTGIPYLRFERSLTEFNSSGVYNVKSFEEAAVLAGSFEGNIFLATGSNTVELFIKNISNYKDRLFVRVLPDSKVLLKCEAAGLAANNILAVKGPFTEAMNIEMLKHCKASVLVTKDSGETGGTGEKLAAAAKMGVKVIFIERPKVEYTQKTGSMEEAVLFAKQCCLGG